MPGVIAEERRWSGWSGRSRTPCPPRHLYIFLYPCHRGTHATLQSSRITYVPIQRPANPALQGAHSQRL